MPAPAPISPPDAQQLSECLRRVADAESALVRVRELLNGFSGIANAVPKRWNDMPAANPIGAVAQGGSSLVTSSTHLASAAVSGAVSIGTKINQIVGMSAAPNKNPDDTCGFGFSPEDILRISQEKGHSAASCQKCWDVFCNADQAQSGYVPLADLGQLLEDACGTHIPPHEVSQIVERCQFEKNGQDQLAFLDFLDVFCSTDHANAEKIASALDRKGEEARNRMVEDRLLTPERVRSIGVPQIAVIDYLREENSQASACLELPWAFLLMGVFCASMITHFHLGDLHAVDEGITFDIEQNANFAFSGMLPFENGRMGHKSIHDVNSIGDFWSWFNLGLVPMFFPEGWDLSEGRTNVLSRCSSPYDSLNNSGWDSSFLHGIENASYFGKSVCPERDLPERPADYFGDPAARGTVYLYYNSIIGGMRLTQERAKVIECPDQISSTLYYGKCSDRTDYMLPPQLHPSFYEKGERLNQEGGETVYLLSKTSQADVLKQLRALEDEVWLSPATEKVDILFATYNAQLQVVTATFIFFHINSGGHIFKHVQPVSIGLLHYHNWWEFAIDGVLMALILRIFLLEVKEIVKSMRRFGPWRGFRRYWEPWNMVDWLAIGYFLLLAVIWLFHLQEVQDLRDELAVADVMLPGSFADPAQRADFFTSVHLIVIHTHAARIVVAFYPFVLVTRFFKAFAAQPRLAIVTDTLIRSRDGILHFGVVFLSITAVYIMSAMALFGGEITEYSTLSRAANSVFRVMMGDFDWEELSQVGMEQTAVWFWSFTWLVNLILLNMLLAIIMDVYAEVKGNIGADAETLITQSIEIFKRWRARQSGTAISILTILLKIDPTVEFEKDLPDIPESVTMNVDGFVTMVPSLPAAQAEEILIEAYDKWEQKSGRGGITVSESTLTTNKIYFRCEQICGYVQELMHMQQMTASLSAAHNKGVKGHLQAATKSMGSGWPGSPMRGSLNDKGEEISDLTTTMREVVKANNAEQLARMEHVMRPMIVQVHQLDSRTQRLEKEADMALLGNMSKLDVRPGLCTESGQASLCNLPVRAGQMQ